MQRFIFALIACFWVFMGWRLWQVEYGQIALGEAVDIQIVWDKILNAQDEADMSIVAEDGTRARPLGWFRWAPSVTIDDTIQGPDVEGMVSKVQDYSLDIELGRLFAEEPKDDLNFTMHLSFGPLPERAWSELQFTLRRNLTDRRVGGTFDARATNKFLTVSLGGTDGSSVDIPYQDLRNPQKITQAGLELAGTPSALAKVMSFSVNAVIPKEQRGKKLDFKFPMPQKANHHLLPNVPKRVKVYLIKLPVVDDMPVKVYVSPLGELLRVELPKLLSQTVRDATKLPMPPGQIVFLNDNYYRKLKRNR